MTLAMFWGKASNPGLWALIPLTAAAQSSQQPAVFRTGTRLVEVEVVVRHQRVMPPGLHASLAYIFDSGPPFGPAGDPFKGLTKEDFTVFDQGKRQPIAVFSTEPAEVTPLSVPPGAVSNRTDSRGQPLNGATAILIDLLNTPFVYTDYARVGMKELVRSLSQTDAQIALYSLGENLHVLHDFSDDPQKLKDAAARMEQGQLPPDFADALRDYGDLTALTAPEAAADTHGRITVSALNRIIQRLAGMSGRKNLVWLAEISQIPPRVMALMQRANVVLYPVMVRCPPPGLAPCGFARPESQVANRNLGTAFGGRGFFDARDLGFAVRAAQEDSSSAYVLGFYPPENVLDGTYHKITVKLHGKALETHYRSGYLATKAALPAGAPIPPTLADLMDDPIAATGIGLVAHATRQAQHPDLYDVQVTVDLHDIHLDPARRPIPQGRSICPCRIHLPQALPLPAPSS